MSQKSNIKYKNTPLKSSGKKSKTPEQALKRLMELCSKSEKSSGDALRLMMGWGVGERHRKNILTELISAKFIDDKRYADAYFREKLMTSKWGAYKINNHLRAKGISADIIESVAAKFDSELGKGRLFDILSKKAVTVKAADNYELKSKLVRYALGQGYEYESVLSAVDSILKEKINR